MENIENKASNEEKVISNTENETKSKINIVEEVKKAISEDNLELKSYLDSIIDKRVSKVSKALQEKSEKERQAKELQEKEEALKKSYEARIKELEDIVNYKDILVKNNLPMELIDLVRAEDMEKTKANIELIKTLINSEAERLVKEKIIINPPIPKDNEGGAYTSSLWGRK